MEKMVSEPPASAKARNNSGSPLPRPSWRNSAFPNPRLDLPGTAALLAGSESPNARATALANCDPVPYCLVSGWKNIALNPARIFPASCSLDAPASRTGLLFANAERLTTKRGGYDSPGVSRLGPCTDPITKAFGRDSIFCGFGQMTHITLHHRIVAPEHPTSPVHSYCCHGAERPNCPTQSRRAHPG